MGSFNKRVTRTRYIYSINIIQLQLNHYVNLPHWDIQGLPSQAPCCAEQLQGEEHVSFLWELMDTLKNYIARSRGYSTRSSSSCGRSITPTCSSYSSYQYCTPISYARFQSSSPLRYSVKPKFQSRFLP